MCLELLYLRGDRLRGVAAELVKLAKLRMQLVDGETSPLLEALERNRLLLGDLLQLGNLGFGSGFFFMSASTRFTSFFTSCVTFPSVGIESRSSLIAASTRA